VSSRAQLERFALHSELLRRRARHHLPSFALYMDWSQQTNYDWNWHHGILYRAFDDFAHGRIKRLIVEAPPGMGKSEAASRNLPAFVHGIDPNCRIMACSHTDGLASEMNLDVQRIIGSIGYQEVFPGRKIGVPATDENGRPIVGDKARATQKIFDIPGHRGYYVGAGVGTAISGRRFDVGIVDDAFKNREESKSPARREAVWRWFTGDFVKRQAKDARIAIINTRWDVDDLVGRIKKKMDVGEIEPYTVITLPGLATDVLHAEDPRAFGEALWPYMRSREALEISRDTEPRDFWSLEQQDPRAEGDVEWGPEYFPESIWFDDWPADLVLTVVALDPSKGKDAKTSDYSAFVFGGRDRSGKLWLEADLERRNTMRIVDDGIELFRRFRAETGKMIDGFGCESDQFQEMLADEFSRRSRSDAFDLPPVFKLTTGGTPKPVRIRRLSHEITTRNIRWRRTPRTRLAVQQLGQFPNGDYDDGPDAAEMFLRLAKHLWSGKRGSVK
jgi:hypothetical protein